MGDLPGDFCYDIAGLGSAQFNPTHIQYMIEKPVEKNIAVKLEKIVEVFVG